jgi:hypothetical protein
MSSLHEEQECSVKPVLSLQISTLGGAGRAVFAAARISFGRGGLA